MSFVKNTYVYLFSNILNAAIPFILLPFLTRYLSPSEYGQVAMFQTMLTGIGAFIGFNGVGAANRKFYDNNISLEDVRKFNGSCVQILFLTLFFALVSVFFLESYLESFLSIPSEWLYLALLVSASTFIIQLRLGQWQVRKHPVKYGLLQIGHGFFNMLITLALVIFYNRGGGGRIDAILYSSVSFAFVSICFLYRDKLIKLKCLDANYIKEILIFGVPLVPHVFGGFLLTASDRFVINTKLGLADAGIYMVAVQVSMAFAIVFDAINKSYVPWLFERLKLDDEKDKIIIVRNTYFYFLCLLFIAVFSFLVGPMIVSLVVGDEYRTAGSLIGWLCLGQVFGGMYLMVTNYIFYAKKTGMLSLVTMSSGLLNIIIMILLVSCLGIQGAAIAFALSKMVQFILTWRLASSVFRMPWDLTKSGRLKL